MKAATQELIDRNIARITAEGGNMASKWGSLDAKTQRRFIATWTRMEREDAAARQQARRNEAADTAWTQIGW